MRILFGLCCFIFSVFFISGMYFIFFLGLMLKDVVIINLGYKEKEIIEKV